ncbi:hypothetical protein O7602_19905 [Micromonospora sp. WMMD1128]|uniref:hypothetical protein n=1 Tax=Micromonospora sp. WMMD1128 TaxID=3015150 RepID=UPI00248CFE45|nr:hypothetical protein [Micromonospora sp. WMMD1128]WBB71993.1 hypothetical protein O7602_19905 [Micromonospora sp. WMMD1128]
MADILQVQQLRQVCKTLLDVVEERFGTEIDLSRVGVDFYWNVDLRTAFEIGSDPVAGIDVGQTSDDLAELHALLRQPADGPPVLWHDLQHLAGVMRLLAYLDLPDVGADQG